MIALRIELNGRPLGTAGTPDLSVLSAIVTAVGKLGTESKGDDPEREKGLQVVANILGFRPPEEGLHYSMNFYAGGTGVDDRLAIRCEMDAIAWPNLVAKLSLRSVATALSDPTWSEGFLWLVCGERPAQNVDDDCCKFINSSKHDFQDVVDINCDFLFSNESDVNSWCVVWISNGHLNYLSFDQG